MSPDEKIELLLRGYRVTYEYEALPLRVVDDAVRFVDPETKPDAYLSRDAETEELKRLLAAGFRWIRTENEMAIFEREHLKGPTA
jgi:hypothetical protein